MSENKKKDPNRRADVTMMKGHSANPRGRPSHSRNMLTIFNAKRDEHVEITIDSNGRKIKVKMPRVEARVTNLWNKAMMLDLKASATVLAIMRANGQLDPAPNDNNELDSADAAVLEALIGRITQRDDD